MAIIVPAILEHTPEDFADTISRVVKLPGIQRVQVDFGDEEFIENRLIDASQMDTLSPAFNWEAHLMIKSPKDFLDYRICGFKTLIVHYEAYDSLAELQQALADIKKMGFKSGVAINLDTKVEVLKELDADQYLIMSVVPGKQGQQFIPEALEKIKELRQLIPHAIIEIDGGVNAGNIKSIETAGCNLICVGSALTKASNMQEAFEQLQRELNKN